MRPVAITAASGLVAIVIVLATFEPLAHADEPACDGSPLPAFQRVTCRDVLERRWREAAQEESSATSPSGARLTEMAEAQAKRDRAQRKRLAAETAWAAYRLQDAYEDSHCERALTLCLDREGELIAGPAEALPASVHPGDKLLVIVLTSNKAIDGANEVITVHFAPRTSLERKFEEARDRARTEVREPAVWLKDTLPPGQIPQVTFEPLPFPSEPVADDATELTISFQRKPTGDAGVDKQLVIPVDRGRSYYSVAFLIAATFKGDRRVLRDLGIISDHAVDPGLALNIFPGGRERGVIGYARKRNSLGRWLANNIGLQIATDLDLTSPTDKLYTGVVFEPIAGLAFVGGITLRKVAVVPPAGGLPTLAAMDASAPSDTRYVTRGYVGITMTMDLLETISTFGTDLRKIKVP